MRTIAVQSLTHKHISNLCPTSKGEIILLKLLFSYKIISKAKRMFLFFKPQQIVPSEKFDIELTFQNLGEKFYGGTFALVLTCPELSLRHSRPIKLLPINEGELQILVIENLSFEFSATWILSLEGQSHYLSNGQQVGGGSSYLYFSPKDEVHDATVFPVPIVTREELYQKYAVIVALWTATISIVVATLSIVISALKP
jgi:hypothetical protein